MGVPPNHPFKLDFPLQTIHFGYPHFRKPPYGPPHFHPFEDDAEEMQSLSLLCAQPLGLDNAGDMSAGDLRSWRARNWNSSAHDGSMYVCHMNG